MVTKGLTILLLAGAVTRTCFIEKLRLKKIHMKTHTIENFCTCEVTNCGKYLQSKSLCKPATLLWKNVITATLWRFWIQVHIGCFPERAYVDDLIQTIKKCSHGVKRVRIRSCSGPHFSRIFPHSDWIRRDTPWKSGKNADQNNSEYRLVLSSACNQLVLLQVS